MFFHCPLDTKMGDSGQSIPAPILSLGQCPDSDSDSDSTRQKKADSDSDSHSAYFDSDSGSNSDSSYDSKIVK